ncbi:hypothetical protein TWF694_004715 [Orbilia ellipsospora]|uniref:C2H2-type domain-containing protein n=1 Tax=Orbilia ellipsospora TaxID=2528407 RepID=A0AAV9WVX8_9PEZI
MAPNLSDNKVFQNLTHDFVKERLDQEWDYEIERSSGEKLQQNTNGDSNPTDGIKDHCSRAECSMGLRPMERLAQDGPFSPLHRRYLDPGYCQRVVELSQGRDLKVLFDSVNRDSFFSTKQSSYIGYLGDSLPGMALKKLAEANTPTQVALAPTTISIKSTPESDFDEDEAQNSSAISTQPESPLSLCYAASQPIMSILNTRTEDQSTLNDSQNHGGDMTEISKTSDVDLLDTLPISAKEKAPKQRSRKSDSLRERSDKWINCGYPGCLRKYLYLDRLKAHRIAFHGSDADPKMTKQPRNRNKKVHNDPDKLESQEEVASPPNKKVKKH